MGKEAPTAEIKLERNSGRFMQDLGERKFADEGSEPTKRSGWSREPCPFALMESVSVALKFQAQNSNSADPRDGILLSIIVDYNRLRFRL